MENGFEDVDDLEDLDDVEDTLKTVISDHIDELALRAQNIAFDAIINNKLAALRQAGEDLKLCVHEKVDNLMIKAIEKRPDQDDPHFDDKIEIYKQWLDEVTQGIRNVQSFFEHIWKKFRELLDKIFQWIKNGVKNLKERISHAFKIIKTTLFSKK